MIRLKQIKSVMIGHAVADALGVPAEFKSRKELDINPITDMVGYGTYDLPEGCWSDDTSMSLCALDVLSSGVCDLDKIMFNFRRWQMNGEFTPTGVLFDIGQTCSMAIYRYFNEESNVNTCGFDDEYSNGNGSLMRIHPFVLYIASKKNKINSHDMDIIFRGSSLTHAHMRSKLACGIYSLILMRIVALPYHFSIYKGLSDAEEYFKGEPELNHFSKLFSKDFEKMPAEQISSSGYVVDSLEAAVWCLLTTKTYKDCVLKAVNLGKDTDTVAAIAGGLAGALYGYNKIPTGWINKLKKFEYIDEMCEKAYKTWCK